MFRDSGTACPVIFLTQRVELVVLVSTPPISHLVTIWLTTCMFVQGYYDNRYWTMWKLPMFGCSDPHQVLAEIDACKRAFSDSYIRLVAFDNIAQCQTIGFLVHRPARSTDYCLPEQRSVA